MRVIRSAQVICDDCGATCTVEAPPRLKATAANVRRALRALALTAPGEGFQMEGPCLMAGDLCRRCRVFADYHHIDYLETAS